MHSFGHTQPPLTDVRYGGEHDENQRNNDEKRGGDDGGGGETEMDAGEWSSLALVQLPLAPHLPLQPQHQLPLPHCLLRPAPGLQGSLQC